MTGGTPVCGTGLFACDGSNVLSSENQNWIISSTVDASALDGEIELCFTYGDSGSLGGESFLVSFNTGSGWQDAWFDPGDTGLDGTCVVVCVDLSAIDASVNNSVFEIRFQLVSDASGDILVLDNLDLHGAQYCVAAASEVTLTTPAEGAPGAYDFITTDTYGNQLTAKIMCSWDADSTVEVTDTVVYQP